MNQPSNHSSAKMFRRHVDESQHSFVDVGPNRLFRWAPLFFCVRHTSILPAPYIAPSAPSGPLLQAAGCLEFGIEKLDRAMAAEIHHFECLNGFSKDFDRLNKGEP